MSTPATRMFESRPTELEGETWEIATPEGDAFVIVNHHEGTPCEVIVNVGKAGTRERALSEALGRLLSTALQYGTPLEALCIQLRGISSEDAIGFGKNKIYSIPDSVAEALEHYLED